MKTLQAMLITLFAFIMCVPLAAAQSQSWDRQINRPVRFIVLSEFGGAAVLDRETGLVWEQSPSTDKNLPAHSSCLKKNVGGRLGWRLPGIQELTSLIDQTQANPALPSGHPFSNVQLDACYRSATLNDPFWSVSFANNGVVTTGDCSGGLGGYNWCVRGGQGLDEQ